MSSWVDCHQMIWAVQTNIAHGIINRSGHGGASIVYLVQTHSQSP